MRPLMILIATCAIAIAGCAGRQRRPDGPYRDAEEFADALSDEAVACASDHLPSGTGSVLVTADVREAGSPPVISGAGSMPGSDPLIACVAAHAAAKLRCPTKAPARYVRVRLPVPLVTAKVTYSFSDDPSS